jgi:hypothetical protein
VLLIAAVVLPAGCASDDEGTATTPETVSAGDVESALDRELGQGGSGIVDLDDEPPKAISCVKDAAGTPSGWRCTVTPSKGQESYFCDVEVDPQTGQTTKKTCARIDN